MADKIKLTDNQKLILDKFRKRIKRERFVNNQSNLYYKKLNSKFVIPGIVITGLCSVASFLSTTESISNDVKTGFSIGVGVLTAVATVIQSISSSFGFQTRSDAYQKSAETYDRLLTTIEFEIYNPTDNFTEFCNTLEKDIIKIKNDCKYLPPYSMYKLYKDQKQQKEEEKSKMFLQSIGYPIKNVKTTDNDNSLQNVQVINNENVVIDITENVEESENVDNVENDVNVDNVDNDVNVDNVDS